MSWSFPKLTQSHDTSCQIGLVFTSRRRNLISVENNHAMWLLFLASGTYLRLARVGRSASPRPWRPPRTSQRSSARRGSTDGRWRGRTSPLPCGKRSCTHLENPNQSVPTVCKIDPVDPAYRYKVPGCKAIPDVRSEFARSHLSVGAQ